MSITQCFILFLTVFLNSAQHVTITKCEDGVTFWYNSLSTHVATYTFDFCDIVRCPTVHEQCDLYKSSPNKAIYICVDGKIYGNAYGKDCPTWDMVGWTTGTPLEYRPQNAVVKKDDLGRSLLDRMTLLKTGRCLNSGKTSSSMQLTLTIQNPSPIDADTYLMGAWSKGETTKFSGKFKLADLYNYPNLPLVLQILQPGPKIIGTMTANGDPTYEDTLATETGYSDLNVWLEWMKYNVQENNKTNCYVCGHARPHLGTVPLTIPLLEEKCFLSLFKNTLNDVSRCKKWKKTYPMITNNTHPGEGITIYPGNYTCYRRNVSYGTNLQRFPSGFCQTYRDGSSTLLINHTQSLGDIYWICGDMKLRVRMSGVWRGECTLAKVIMPLHIVPTYYGDPSSILQTQSRKKRDTSLSSEPRESFDPHVYIDTIGVPRGVPNEFKARNQVAAGFESLIPMIGVNKNVAWINYIYYNQQRFVNYTKDALKGIAEQLEATSHMTFQNRMALDMILAEKGGVCKMLPATSACCTYIPDNTGPNGKITLAIKKLAELGQELKENSGTIDNWDSWFSWMNGWQKVLLQAGMAILVVIILLAFLLCCIIPCMRTYLQNAMEKASSWWCPQNLDTDLYGQNDICKTSHSLMQTVTGSTESVL